MKNPHNFQVILVNLINNPVFPIYCFPHGRIFDFWNFSTELRFIFQVLCGLMDGGGKRE